MDDLKKQAIIEGILFLVGDEGIELKQIADILGESIENVKLLIDKMKIEYQNETRGLQIIEIAGIYQFSTKAEHSLFYKKLININKHTAISNAALETLAIIAYKQPITRLEIEEIRGVKSDRAIQTLLQRKLIKELGRLEGLGRPILYGITKDFLIYFGIDSIAELPLIDEMEDDNLHELFKELNIEEDKKNSMF